MFPELAEYRRTSTRLHPRPGSPKPQESSVAGPFLWPADEPWPMCHAVHEKGRGRRLADVRLRRRILEAAWRRDPKRGPSDEERAALAGIEDGLHAPELGDADPIPLLAAAQLFTRDVPGLVGPEGCDLLQVFWCPFEAHGPDQAMDVVLKWRRAQEVGQLLTDIPEPIVVGRSECVPNACVLHPEQVIEHEWAELLSEDVQERIEAWEEEMMDAVAESETDGDEYELSYTGDLSIAPGWKVGGFATWGLTGPARIDCSCGVHMRPLLTVNDQEWDRGSLTWVPLEDREAIETMGASDPTGVYVGRGQMRIFTCPADPTHPHRLDFQ
ncbi:hypothetical protein ACH4TX_43275 [Streptomyces sp. NPDC021098]|uniref:hypothetical protein n=1 Tax=unclassified Streptomyces TaxID=2593676 RepID=UPI00379CBE7A